jgi:branched-chain amino acid transport system permease protein
MDYLLHIGIVSMITIIFAVSLDIELGHAGLYNFGQMAFFGIGAYTSALLTLAGAPVPVGIAAALLSAALAGALVAYPILRLTGDHFGIATLAFGEMARLLFLNERWLTKGPMGLPGIPRPSFPGLGHSLAGYLLFVTVPAVLTVAFSTHLVRSPFGRALRTLRDDEEVAQAFGKNVVSLKVRCVTVGSALAGLAGSLWAHYTTYISPNDFTLEGTIVILLCVVLGGRGTAWGAVLGAVLVVLFQEVLRFLPIPGDWGRLVAPLQGMVFGLGLVVLMLKRPQGLLPAFRS